MGRYKESTESKKLKGTLRPSRERKASQEHSPFIHVSEVDIPADLPKLAQHVYHATADGLIQYRTLTPLDLQGLRQYAYQCWLISEAEKNIKKDGAVIDQTNARGFTNKVKNPWVAILQESTTLANRLGAGFGLSPQHRQKLNMELPKKTGRLAQLMAGEKPNPFDEIMRESDPDYDPMDGILD